jgi:diaminohydroxyphosphoribosylaminopyrimidine deaminase/5-amino-6-(5-phosphoribosylamino)uracil reductase
VRGAGIDAKCFDDVPSGASLRGYVRSKTTGFPATTLKLAVTADGFIARPDGTSKWITGEPARAHAHRERARMDAILVGGGTLRADSPSLDVRLPGLENHSPRRLVLTRDKAPPGWTALAGPAEIAGLGLQYLLVEGGAEVGEAFLAAALVDRLLVYRSPTRFGEGIPAFRDPGPAGVPLGWQIADRRQLGSDTLEVYYPGEARGS